MKYLKKFFRECFRYRLSGISLTVCLVLSMLSAYYGITIFQNLYYEQKEKNEFAYPYTTTFHCKVEDFSDLPDLPEGSQCNLKLCDYEMYLSKNNDTHLVQIILHSEEENWPLVSGHFPDSNEINNGENWILIGQAMLENTYKENGHLYCDVFGDKYKVAGILGSKNSAAFDYYVVLYGDCLGEKTKQAMVENGLGDYYDMILESNATDTEIVFQKYIKEQYNSSSGNAESYFNASAVPVYNEKEFCIIIYLFCFVCISIIMKFWMMQRTHEMQVCKAFGFSNARVILRLANSFGCIFLFSLILFSICCVVLNQVIKGTLKEYHMGFSPNIIIPYCVVFFVAVMIVSVKPVSKLVTKSIAGTMKER